MKIDLAAYEGRLTFAGLKLNDSERLRDACFRGVLTVGDLVGAVSAAKADRSAEGKDAGDTPAVLTLAESLERIRSAVERAWNVPADRLRPDARLAELPTGSFAKRWRDLGYLLADALPEPTHRPPLGWVLVPFYISAAVGTVMGVIVAIGLARVALGLPVRMDLSFWTPFTAVTAVLGYGVTWIASRFRVPPAHCATVADLAAEVTVSRLSIYPDFEDVPTAPPERRYRPAAEDVPALARHVLAQTLSVAPASLRDEATLARA
jgi:hypothetical protein